MHEKNIALIGNPNVGKTVIFNFFTNSFKNTCDMPCMMYCNNIKNNKYKIFKLSGIYSLSIYSDNEIIINKFLENKSNLIVNVIDSTDIKRNLYLTIQLLEQNQNIIIALNKMNIAKQKYKQIDVKLLSEILNVDINLIESYKKDDLENLKKNILKNSSFHKFFPKKKEFNVPYDIELENSLYDLKKYFIKKKIKVSGYSNRRLAISVLEKNKIVYEQLKKYKQNYNIFKFINNKIKKLEMIYKEDLETIFIEQRYKFIDQIIKKIIIKKIVTKKLNYSDKIDKFMLHPFFGLVIFFIIIFLMFQFTFLLGNYFKGFIEIIFKNMTILISKNISYKPLVSFLNNGIINGLGTIISFLPNLIIIFLILTFFEESGYMLRISYLTDKFMRFFGLQGKAFIPLFTGFGCSIPAILSTNILENKSDRIITILVASLISCNGRLPLYLLFISILFPHKYQGTVLFSIYFLGIILAICLAKCFRKLFFKKNNDIFVLKLPTYNFPNIKLILIYTWFKIKDFLNRTITILLLMVVIIWILSFFPIGVEYGSKESFIGQIGSLVSIIFKPIGFGNYPATISLLSGIIAKEGIATTLGTIYGSINGISINQTISTYWTPLQAYSFLIMSSIYIPCVATLATIKKETNLKWMFFVLLYSTILAYVLSFLVYQIGTLLFKLN